MLRTWIGEVFINQPKCGAHAFRRFRNTYLRNRANAPSGLREFWMGWGGDPTDAETNRADAKKDMSIGPNWTQNRIWGRLAIGGNCMKQWSIFRAPVAQMD